MKNCIKHMQRIALMHSIAMLIVAFSGTYLYAEQQTDTSFDKELFEQAANYLDLPLAGQEFMIRLESDYDFQPELIIKSTRSHSQEKKDWTFIVYMAGDNDLRSFVARNIRQMAQIGSNQHINIVVHLDVSIAGSSKITRRYFIDKNKVIHVNQNDPTSQCMDSGDPETLISCCRWAINSYPAEHYALVFWNHGTGILDPARGRIINPSSLFSFNPGTNLLELDRSIGFMDVITCTRTQEGEKPRGICWDDTRGNFLNNQKLEYALDKICTTILNRKKFSIIAFDACLMSMIEVANITKKYTDIMVGSQEVELGTGWDYGSALLAFEYSSLSPEAFARNIVEAYRQTYQTITHDFTQSAVWMNKIDTLETSINAIARILLECLKEQQNNSVTNAIRASRNRLAITSFDEPSYIDLRHYLENLRSNLNSFRINNGNLINALAQEIDRAISVIGSAVLANVAGKNLPRACGISIYFPEKGIDQSYPRTTFAQTNAWNLFLTNFLYR